MHVICYNFPSAKDTFQVLGKWTRFSWTINGLKIHILKNAIPSMGILKPFTRYWLVMSAMNFIFFIYEVFAFNSKTVNKVKF